MLMGVPMFLVLDPLLELATISSVFIKQEINIFEVLTGCETKSRFHVYARTQFGYKYLFKCKEESGWCERNCLLSSSRPFKMKIKHVAALDQFGNDFSDSATFAEFNRPYKCTCFCLQRPVMKGVKNNGEYFGQIKFPFSCCDPKYEVVDKFNNLKYVVTGDCCQCGLMCRTSYGMCSEVMFQIRKPDNEQVGFVKKVFSGLVQELLTSADNFELQFPKDSTPEDKLMLIGNVLMIDYTFFEDKGRDRNRFGSDLFK
jgi:hypothetical protein